ncbi:hypothetical protein ACWCPT_29420 [Streptomyces sp. NPDC002308]
MTRIIHHNGQNPAPGSNTLTAVAAAAVIAYAALTLTTEQFQYLVTLLGAPSALLGLARLLDRS